MPETAVAERTLPHNLEAERSVLGAILIHNEAYNFAVELVSPTDFFRDAHRRIFDRMVKLSERSDAIDLVTLKDELGRSGELDEVGGPAYIAALVDGVPRSTNVEYYARIVKEKSILRNLIVAMEHARDEHLRAEADLDQSRPEEDDIVAALGMLADSYSNLGGPSVKATMEKPSTVRSREKAFLILRAAEWGLEAMALRKRSGEITLHFSGDADNASLRIVALPDNPDFPLRLSPKETDEANVLQQSAALQGGSFSVSRGPTGFALLLIIPVER